MKCAVCGMDYGLSHNCSGIAPLQAPEETAPPPSGFAPLYYLRLAFDIVRWDDVAIRRASRDSNALLYGIALFAISVLCIFFRTAFPALSRLPAVSTATIVGLVIGIVFMLAYMGVIVFIQLGACHLIAKWFFGATGTFLGVMRPLLLAWFVNCLILIPVLGMLAAGIAWTAVLMMVFEEVDGIGRLQAFGISAGINICFALVQLALPQPH
jgi:bacteriorhodopsin